MPALTGLVSTRCLGEKTSSLNWDSFDFEKAFVLACHCSDNETEWVWFVSSSAQSVCNSIFHVLYLGALWCFLVYIVCILEAYHYQLYKQISVIFWNQQTSYRDLVLIDTGNHWDKWQFCIWCLHAAHICITDLCSQQESALCSPLAYVLIDAFSFVCLYLQRYSRNFTVAICLSRMMHKTNI